MGDGRRWPSPPVWNGSARRRANAAACRLDRIGSPVGSDGANARPWRAPGTGAGGAGVPAWPRSAGRQGVGGGRLSCLLQADGDGVSVRSLTGGVMGGGNSHACGSGRPGRAGGLAAATTALAAAASSGDVPKLAAHVPYAAPPAGSTTADGAAVATAGLGDIGLSASCSASTSAAEGSRPPLVPCLTTAATASGSVDESPSCMPAEAQTPPVDAGAATGLAALASRPYVLSPPRQPECWLQPSGSKMWEGLRQMLPPCVGTSYSEPDTLPVWVAGWRWFRVATPMAGRQSPTPARRRSSTCQTRPGKGSAGAPRRRAGQPGQPGRCKQAVQRRGTRTVRGRYGGHGVHRRRRGWGGGVGSRGGGVCALRCTKTHTHNNQLAAT